jgi:hypothetical protein
VFTDEDHESFASQPSPDETVWRYMDLARYVSLLQSSALHFARADQMRDRWEGSYSELNLTARARVSEADAAEDADWTMKRREAMQRLIYMSCWHLSSVESAAMWDLYQREGRGVAIRSTWGSLTQSITDHRWVNGAKVSYVDYSQVLIPEWNVFYAFLHKRESFAHEREVRLLMLGGQPDTKDDIVADFDEQTWTPEGPVVPIAVDLAELVDAVYVAPEAPDWIRTVVAGLTSQYGYQFPVLQSDLDRDPIA